MAGSSGVRPRTQRGLPLLAQRCEPDGTCPEDAIAGFPTVSYLTYALYRDYFPVLAPPLARETLSPAACEMPLTRETRSPAGP